MALVIGSIFAFLGKLVIDGFILVNSDNFHFSASTLSSFFSSVVQGFLGLAAFMGAVAFFALESNQNKLARSAEELSRIDTGTPIIILLRHYRSIEETENKTSYLDKMQALLGITLQTNDPRTSSLVRMYESWEFDNEVKDRTMNFTTSAFWHVIFSIILLACSDWLSTNTTWSILALSFSFGLSLFVLKEGTYFIRRVVG